MFFENFRRAAARLPAGLLRAGSPATPDAIAAAQRALRVELPEDYASFLRSFDGADLFHESILVAGVGAGAARSLLELNPQRPVGELVFAEAVAGDRFVFRGQAVVRLRAGSDERTLAGTTFARWLDATVARDQMLYGPDGEFAPDAFEPDGEEVTARTALRQAERALRHDPEAAEAHHERGVALRRLGRVGDALAAFERAGALDPGNPWPWFDLGRAALEADPRRAVAAFRRAAEIEAGPPGARILAWAALAAAAGDDPAAAAEARAAALARHPGLGDDLRRAAAAALADGDPEAAEQAQRLVGAIEPPPSRVRLPLLGEAAAAQPPPASSAGSRERPRPPAGPEPRSGAGPAREPAARPAPPAPPRRPRPAAPPPRRGSPRGPKR